MGDVTELLVDGPGKPVTLGGIPLWFDDPNLILGHWSGELAALLGRFDRDISALVQGEAGLLAATRGRLAKIRQAVIHNKKAIAQLFAEARLSPSPAAPGKGDGMSLLSAWFQMLRDWGWHDDTEENEHGARQVLAALGEQPEVGKLLVLGGGAGRLAYDVHVRARATRSLLLDNNPLPSLVGRRVVAGSHIELYEVPRNPKSPEVAAILRDLYRSGPEVSDFHFVLADARVPVVRPGSFDTVLTPWYVDRVDQPLDAVVATVYRALAPGGRWVNHGPLIYDARPISGQLTLPELLELVEARGFRREHITSQCVPYLEMQASSSGRLETVHTIAWRRDDGPVPNDPVLPQGLIDPTAPMERFAGLADYRAPNQAVAFIVAQVDGARTARQIAATMAPRLQMTPEKATALVLMTLKQVWRSTF
jgi:SAM-dependent methyltransferase